MQETKRVRLFNIKPIIHDVEEVIQKGLNKLLVNYIERHEMLEKTHQQLMQLPSIVEELNEKKGKTGVNDSEYEDDDETEQFTEEHNIFHDKLSSLENKLQRMEKNYDTIIPILDKLVNKITTLNDEVKELKHGEIKLEDTTVHTTDIIEKSSVVKTSENENIEIHIEEPSEELQEEDISDDEVDVNPLLITCSTITLKKEVTEEKVEAEEVIEEDEELSVEEELGIEEVSKEDVINCETNQPLFLTSPSVKDEEKEESAEEDEVEEEPAEEEVASIETETKEEVEDESAEEEVASVETETKEEVEDDEVASVETETKEEVEEEDEDIFEIEIDDKTYCTNDDENGFIWELTEEGEQGDKVGYLKDGEPFFYADEN